MTARCTPNATGSLYPINHIRFKKQVTIQNVVLCTVAFSVPLSSQARTGRKNFLVVWKIFSTFLKFLRFYSVDLGVGIAFTMLILPFPPRSIILTSRRNFKNQSGSAQRTHYALRAKRSRSVVEWGWPVRCEAMRGFEISFKSTAPRQHLRVYP